MKALLAAAAALGLIAAPSAHAALPPIRHVYIIVEENESASTTFGPNSPAPYLSKTLRAQGAYLPNYYGVGHESNDNYIAMVSGQAPNAQTQGDCQFYDDFVAPTTGAYGQVGGSGCIYPAGTPTIVSQLAAKGLTWRDYNDSMGADPTRETVVCGHPTPGSQDHTQSATATDQYATRHNPFVYFHSIIDDTALCDTHVVNLDPLAADLAGDTPNYVFVTPSLCDDGHDSPCKNGQPGGLTQADSFLRQWVPRITSSPSFKYDGGLLLIVFDEAATSDTRACCKEIPGPGSPSPGINGPGGGDTGAVLLSPYIKPGTVSTVAYNHYSMLRSIEDLFGLPHIGYAQLPGEVSFGSDVFACAPAAPPVATGGRLPNNSEIENVHIRRHKRRVTLTLYSVGAAKLRVTIRAKHTRTRRITRQLAPCTSYSLKLPSRRLRHHRKRRVTISAQAYGAAQTVRSRY